MPCGVVRLTHAISTMTHIQNRIVEVAEILRIVRTAPISSTRNAAFVGMDLHLSAQYTSFATVVPATLVTSDIPVLAGRG